MSDLEGASSGPVGKESLGGWTDRQKGPVETLSLFREASLDTGRTEDGQEGGDIGRWSQ